MVPSRRRSKHNRKVKHESDETCRNQGGGQFCLLISAIIALSASFGAFAEDAYIQSNGANTINTGYYASRKTKISVDFQLTKIEANHDTLFGHYGNDFSFLCYCVGGQPFRAEAKDGGHQNWPLQPEVTVDTARHTIVVDAPNRHMTLSAADGTLQAERDFNTAWTLNAKSNWPLLLFGSSKNEAGESRQQVYAKIYGVKIWETENGVETLVHNYVPAMKGRDAGFYDEKTGEFRYGTGPYELVCGGDGVKTIPDDGYLQSSGSQYFNTGYKMNPNSRIEVDFQYPNAATTGGLLFGSWKKESDGMSAFMWNDGTPKQYKFQVKDGGYAGAANLLTGVYCSDTNRFTAVIDVPARNCRLLRNGYVRANHTVSSAYTLNNTATCPMVLFGGAEDETGTGSQFVSARIYSAKIYEKQQNGTYAIVKEFVPYVKDGTAGFLEKQTGVFKAVDGISCGGAIETEGISDAYIQNDGKTTLNLGYKAKTSSRIECDYQWLNLTKSTVICGAWNDSVTGIRYCCWNNNGNSGKIQFIFDGNSKAQQSTADIIADLKRYTAVMDMKNRQLAYVTDGITNSVAVNSEANLTNSPDCSHEMGVFGGIPYNASMTSYARIYAVRIYEDNKLIHEFLPYKNGDTVSLYDTKTGDVATRATASMAWPTIGGKGVDGEEKWIIEPKGAMTLTKNGGEQTIKAVVAGAVSYKWTKNGEALTGGEDGANGEITVSWEKRNSSNTTDTYTVTPVYDVFGIATDGEPKTVEVTNEPQGLMIIVR